MKADGTSHTRWDKEHAVKGLFGLGGRLEATYPHSYTNAD